MACIWERSMILRFGRNVLSWNAAPSKRPYALDQSEVPPRGYSTAICWTSAGIGDAEGMERKPNVGTVWGAAVAQLATRIAIVKTLTSWTIEFCLVMASPSNALMAFFEPLSTLANIILPTRHENHVGPHAPSGLSSPPHEREPHVD